MEHKILLTICGTCVCVADVKCINGHVTRDATPTWQDPRMGTLPSAPSWLCHGGSEAPAESSLGDQGQQGSDTWTAQTIMRESMYVSQFT